MIYLAHLFHAAGHAEAGQHTRAEAALKAARDAVFRGAPVRPRIQALIAAVDTRTLTNEDIVEECLAIIHEARGR